MVYIHARVSQPRKHAIAEVVPSNRALQSNRNAQFRQRIRSIRSIPAKVLLDRIDPNRESILDPLHGPNENILNQVPRYDNFAKNSQVFRLSGASFS